MDKLIQIANFLRLIDEDGLLSLTNIAVILVLIKVALTKSPDLGSLGILLTALSGYNLKRYLKTKAPKVGPADQIAELKSQMNGIKLRLGIDEGRLK